MWLEAVLDSTGELYKLSNPSLNLLGYPDYSIYQHLQNHSSVGIVSMCQCGTFYHIDYFFLVRTLEQIEILGTPRRLNEAKMPFCLKCNKLRVLLDLIPIKNWLLVFKIASLRPLSPKLDDIPKILTVGNELFKLEFLSFSQDATPKAKHEVSLQFIRHNWYLFDSGRSPKFTRWYVDTYNLRNAFLSTVVYFKC